MKIMESHGVMAAENPFSFGQLLNAIYFYLQKPTEITLLNTENFEICQTLRKKFLPESIFVMFQNENQLKGLEKYSFFSGKEFDKTRTTVFVCKDFKCSLPLKSLFEIEKLL